MRVVPLLSSALPPEPWMGFGAVELRLDESAIAPWIGAQSQGLEVHAIHCPDSSWWANPAICLPPGLFFDFLVLPMASAPDRQMRSHLLHGLEQLLAATQGRGPRVLLQPLPGELDQLTTLLSDGAAHAVGVCWNASGGEDPGPVADRIFSVVASPEADLKPLSALGYRWNVAVAADSPDSFEQRAAQIQIPPVVPLAFEEPYSGPPLTWGSVWNTP